MDGEPHISNKKGADKVADKGTDKGTDKGAYQPSQPRSKTVKTSGDSNEGAGAGSKRSAVGPTKKVSPTRPDPKGKPDLKGKPVTRKRGLEPDRSKRSSERSSKRSSVNFPRKKIKENS